jgi:hypothetical protein
LVDGRVIGRRQTHQQIGIIQRVKSRPKRL